jgi:hypothetical protein
MDIPNTPFLPVEDGTLAGSITLYLHHVMHPDAIPPNLKRANVTVSLRCLIEDAILAIKEEFSEKVVMKEYHKRLAERDEEDAAEERSAKR